ncbi:prephenate dehydrogenase [Acidithiobacillus sp. IBUN Pt1247-S3]|uniref:prephenate dehydrogenase n=1 Tax=Acidithiobacillus sp. IBUN Pt1247-S3 TaxID=3166642 RepID=UPI0034E4C9F3
MAAFPFRRIAIIGLGLMGGSLALALRAQGFSGSLLGAGGSVNDLQLARAAQRAKAGVVFDLVSEDPADLPLSDVDLLILAVPPAYLPTYFALAAQALPGTAVVTDLASVKGDNVAAGEALLGARYLSSHPLIGAEQHGFAAARADLYSDYRCVLCHAGAPDAEVEARLSQFWESLGAELLLMDAAAHDEALAATSHLPHLLAFAYLDMLGEEPDLTRLAGGGLRDFSRIAASDPELWADILWQNRAAVQRGLRRLQKHLALFDAELTQANPSALATSLARGQHARSRFRFPSQ